MLKSQLTKQFDPLDLIYDQNREQVGLTAIFDTYYTRIQRATHEVVRTAFPEIGPFRVDDHATRRVLMESAARAVRVDLTTQNAIREALVQGQEEGLSAFQQAERIDHLFQETWKSRAMTVARTEIGHAQLFAAQDRYRATGIVDEVEIIDGDDWDDECANRNGRRVPVSQQVELLHPNCTAIVVPVVRGFE